MGDIYGNIDDYNPNKKREILIVFGDMNSDMFSNKKLQLIVTELFMRGSKINIYLVFISQSYFAGPKNIRLNSTYYFIMKIPSKRKLKQKAINHSSNIDFNGFMNVSKKSTAKTYSFLTIDNKIGDEKRQCDISREA